MLDSLLEELMLKKLSLTSAQDNTKDVLPILIKSFDKDIEQLLKDNGQYTPPIDPMAIKNIGSAKIVRRTLPRSVIGADGSLEPCEQGFILSIASELNIKGKSSFRLRSTVAHELMHTFFYNTDRVPPQRLGKRTMTRRDYEIEEGLCCYLTREFLMPKFILLGKFNIKEPSLKNLDSLKKTFNTSSDIVAFRLIIDLQSWSAVFLKTEKEGNLLKVKTRLKSKVNPFYKYLRLPRYIPEVFPKGWTTQLTEHIQTTFKKGENQELISVMNKTIALESKIESRNPESVATIAYELKNP